MDMNQLELKNIIKFPKNIVEKYMGWTIYHSHKIWFAKKSDRLIFTNVSIDYLKKLIRDA